MNSFLNLYVSRCLHAMTSFKQERGKLLYKIIERPPTAAAYFGLDDHYLLLTAVCSIKSSEFRVPQQ
jgi:hypothetical protein